MRHFRNLRTSLRSAVVIAAGWSAATTFAHDGDLAPLIASLDAPDLESRNNAMHRLIELECTFEALTAAAKSLDLTAEQRTRLDRVMFERFQQTPRAGLGVGFDTQFTQGVRLASVEPTFPASKFLQPMDLVTSVEGVSLSAQQTQLAWQGLRHRIISFDPGQTMPMVIRRGDQTLNIDVPLGSAEDLPRSAVITAEDHVSAWSYRRERLGIELRDGGRIRPPSRAGSWSPMTPLDQFNMNPKLGLLAGGTPNARPALRLADMAQIARRNIAMQSRIVVRDVQPRGVAVPAVNDPNQINAQARRELVRMQIKELEQNLVQFRIRAVDPALTEQDRSRWAQQLVNAEARLAALKQQFEAAEKP